MKEIFERVSIRKYEDRPVEKEKIEAVLKAAMAAPSAGNQQPWEFWVVSDREKINALSQISPYSGCAKGAPVVLVTCSRDADAMFPEMIPTDLAIATENAWLEITAQGMGGVWLGTAPLEDRMKQVEEILGIPECIRAYALLPFGYPAEARRQQDRYDESRIHWV